ncbi:hypothetical protein FACS189419_01700 [Planctomycetales bacterium]|nr:hypothetical protein FACS189419_01700 [Planctomycetales bacterium]
MEILAEEVVQIPNTRFDRAENNSDELSTPHIRKWQKLVSQTNWEKGTLILQWRNDLIAAGMPNSAYSDESWARRVDISPQHTGRLRRTAERFAGKQKDYAGLYWSHFNAALDWDDAELWLEGAVQNGWSVSQMKVRRAETVGATEELKPREEDIYVGEIGEDPYRESTPSSVVPRTSVIGAADITEGFDADKIQDTEPVKPEKKPKKERQKPIEAVAAFENITTAVALSKLQCLQLPADVMDAIEPMKLAVLNHKAAAWKEVTQAELANCFDLFKSLIYSTEQ